MRKILCSILVLVAALVVFASASAAGPPATATGTWAVTGPPTFTDRHTEGQNTFLTATFPVTWAGDLTGPSVVYNTTHVKSDGSAAAHGTTVCTGCTIGGRTGDFTGTFLVQIAPPPDRNMEGQLTVLSATGGLVGLHGVLRWEGSFSHGTYSFTYSFEP